MAALTYFHRKRPSKKVPLFMEFDQETREEIRLLSLFLLLAERMDKSHRQIVRTVRFEARKEGGLQLSLRAPEECPIERDLVRGSAKLVRKVFRQEIPVTRHVRGPARRGAFFHRSERQPSWLCHAPGRGPVYPAGKSSPGGLAHGRRPAFPATQTGTGTAAPGLPVRRIRPAPRPR